jgi:molybdopterin/thiamine biosynthesis adenylyltransferase
MGISTIRHDEVFPVHKYDYPVTVIGVGAIGSRVGMALVELGLTKLTFIDFDEVEAHNLANQAFMDCHIGVSKVYAMEDLVRMKLGYVPDTMTFLQEKVTPESQTINHGTVFMCVDSIEARRMLIEKFKQDDSTFNVFDTRMASTHGNVVYVNMIDELSTRKYFKNLPENDDNTELSACGSTLTVGTTASLIANLAVWQFMHLRHEPAAMEENIEIFFKPLTLCQ